ncbi:transketolase family protein [Frigoribacterium sp. 2-23]|uniref:transketolase family protein n=1 Tax=Frigoribacterium sp. 2-23 TaxID=3415006 RepID=UPI003C6F0F7B
MANDDVHPTRSENDPSGVAALLEERASLEERAVAAAVAIPAEVVQAKGHGHAGTAMALAPLAHTLFQHVLRHDPADPQWAGRDRFVLSAGHASLLLYTQLVLTGYDLRLDELARSRTLGSRTPGHPELHHTAGVDMSTGPLGQGVASAVGLALAARRDEALHGAGTGLFAPTVWVVAGDGCLEEGVSGEASSLAGTLGLDNLVLVWDDNRITIDGGTDVAFAEDVRARYRAYGWQVLDVDDATDRDALRARLEEARVSTGRPTLVAVRSVIGAPSVLRAGTPAAHAGGFGADEVAAVKTTLGFAADATLADLVPDDVRDWALGARERGRALHERWDADVAAWREAHPAEAAARDALQADVDEAAVDAVLAGIPVDSGAATRTTSGAALVAARTVGRLWGGSADLSSSTNVAVPGEPVTARNPGGDFVHFGIREHAMTAILSGIALHGLWRPYGSTYLAFSDYARPSIRLAALMGLPSLYVYTHDSVAVGEDGPTHQPVEQIATLRAVPGLDVVRPADAREVVAAWRRLLVSPTGPTALALSRQNLPDLEGGTASVAGTARGAYVLWRSTPAADPATELALVAAGSEVHVALAVARTLAASGTAVRVVSMPCHEWFEAEPREYRDEVLPPSLRARVTVEAGSRQPWYRWAGLDGEVVGIDEFGESGSGPELLHLRGVDEEAVLAAARRLLG